jgi:hypothetical protein
MKNQFAVVLQADVDVTSNVVGCADLRCVDDDDDDGACSLECMLGRVEWGVKFTASPPPR